MVSLTKALTALGVEDNVVLIVVKFENRGVSVRRDSDRA